MLASFDEAEDAVRETFLRASRERGTFDGSSLIRASLSMSLGPWVYMPRGGVRPYRAMMSGSHAGWANGNW